MQTLSPAITVRNLQKHYLVREREAGILPALRSLFQHRLRRIAAVEDVSFEIAQGEIVGFLGPNGAGKTTTLKMLAGLLYPTAGELQVLGHIPSCREKALLQQITLVMGQRSQLWWDIPASDALELNRVVYRIPQSTFHHTLDELTDLLDLDPLLRKPVRTLSLGERMKCELAASLLHRPRVLFLDEPTLGLDVTMQRRIRAFISEYNRRHEATVLLTSHYMADVEVLCRRVIVIHRGKLLFDGDLIRLVERFSPHKMITVALEKHIPILNEQWRTYGEIIASNDERVTLRVPKANTANVTERLLAELPVADLSVEDPSIEDVIEQVFTQEVA